MSFYHLRTRSEYSLLTSACKLADLENYIKENNIKAMCLMDDMSMSAGLRWSMHLGDMQVQPLIGLNVFIGKEIYDLNNSYPQLGLIAKNENGYLNMLKLLRCGHFEHEENDFQQLWIKMDELKQYSEDVVLLTGGYRGVIGYEFLNFGAKMATDTLDELRQTFGDRMYIELTRHGRTKEKELEDFLIDYAYKYNIPLVATNDVCFLKREHFTAFDALACIRDKVYLTDPTRKRLNEEYYLKSSQEMEELFGDIPEAILNTEQIVKRCNFLIHKRKPTLPHFCDSPEKEAEMMEDMAYKGMEFRFQQINWDKALHKKEEYLERLKYEIEVIEKMGFPGYFLIVADFVQWSKNNGVAVGAGRGSGAGSLVAWCLKITEVDPLEYGLFFERFLNPERVSMPDFDIDFCQENRWKTIEYVMNKYGKDNVSRIITYGKMKAKMVIKDVGRVMQMSFNDTNEIVKLIPFNPLEPITLDKALEMIPKLKEAKENDPKMAKMMDIAMCLEDLNRNTSMHAAGVVIGDKPLVEIGPVCSEEDEEINVSEEADIDDENVVSQVKSINHAVEELDENGNVIKKSHHKKEDVKLTGDGNVDWFNSRPEHRIAVFGYDMKDCEKIGLVKFDFLGLQTLTVLSKACEMIKKNTGKEINIDALPVDDKKTFDLLAKGHLKGIFQLETPLPRNALKRIKTDKILDIAAITSLNRPGPMENMPAFIRRKLGDEKCDYYHPILEPILKETYGIIIYQEQVMEVARKIAGYSLGEADLLRRAMGKKIKEEMDKQKDIFCERAEKLGLVSKDEAVKLFDVIEKFAGYGFNKAHAVSYTIISYQTAYLKAHYPVEFMVALMNLDINKTDKLNGFVNEAANMGIEIIPPDVNVSTAEFSCRDGKIVYALGAIKGMGVVFAEDICRIRDEGGKFKDLQDFFTRCGRGLKNKNLFSKKTIESLCKSGAWKTLGVNRRTILENIQSLVEVTQEWAKRDRENNTARVMNMFGEDDSIPQIPKLKQYSEYSDEQLSALEFEIFGFYMNTHPLDPYRDKIEAFKFEEGQDVLETTYKNETRLLMCGVITEVRMRFKNRKKFAFVHLLDFGGLYETSLFNDDLINQKADVLVEGHKVVIEASASTSAETGTRIQIKDIYDLDEFFAKHKTRADVKLGANRKYKTSNNSDFTNYSVSIERAVSQQNHIFTTNINTQTSFYANTAVNFEKPVKKSIASNTFSGVVSSTIQPDRAVYIDVKNPVLEIPQIKARISNGEFNGYDNLVIKHEDSEVVLRITNINA